MNTPRKGDIVKQHRKEQREAMSKEERHVVALEEIADHLGEIRSQLIQVNSTLGMLLRKG